MPDFENTYPDEPEGPEEINPAFLAQGKRAEVLLRNPESWTMKDCDACEGTGMVRVTAGVESCARCAGVGKVRDQVFAPDPKWLSWSEVPLIEDVWNCRHGFSMCAECADSWGQDYFIRFWDGDRIVWLSLDHPDHPDNKS